MYHLMLKLKKKSVWLKFRFSFVLPPGLKIFAFLAWQWDLTDFINTAFLLLFHVCVCDNRKWDKKKPQLSGRHTHL